MNSPFPRHLVQDPPSRNLDVRTRSSIRRPKGRSSIPQSIRLPGPGSGGRVAMLIHSWNEVILVIEESHTNMSKLYDYARSHIWVDVVAQIIGWLT